MTRRRTARTRAHLRAAEAVVRRRYSELDLTLADVAAEVGCSPRQLQRAFETQAAETFREHLLRVRMERARVLLARKTDPLSIRAAAPFVGYRKPSGLRQAFRRYWGINPSEVQAGEAAIDEQYDTSWREAEEGSSVMARSRIPIRP